MKLPISFGCTLSPRAAAINVGGFQLTQMESLCWAPASSSTALFKCIDAEVGWVTEW